MHLENNSNGTCKKSKKSWQNNQSRSCVKTRVKYPPRLTLSSEAFVPKASASTFAPSSPTPFSVINIDTMGNPILALLDQGGGRILHMQSSDYAMHNHVQKCTNRNNVAHKGMRSTNLGKKVPCASETPMAVLIKFSITPLQQSDQIRTFMLSHWDWQWGTGNLGELWKWSNCVKNTENIQQASDRKSVV